MKTEFTAKELAVLQTAYESMKGNGFDFGYVDDCRPEGMTAKSAGAVLRGLRKKLALWSDDEFGQLCADWKGGGSGGDGPGLPPHGGTFEVWLDAIKRTN